MAHQPSETELAQERTEQAARRTEFAEDRTIQATERTFAGWLRTALAAVGIGIAFHALFGRFGPYGLAKGIATLFILLGAAIALTAGRRAQATFRRLEAHQVDRASVPSVLWISWSIAAGALALTGAIWLLHEGD
jgi:putative membrane protein